MPETGWLKKVLDRQAIVHDIVHMIVKEFGITYREMNTALHAIYPRGYRYAEQRIATLAAEQRRTPKEYCEVVVENSLVLGPVWESGGHILEPVLAVWVHGDIPERDHYKDAWISHARSCPDCTAMLKRYGVTE